MTNRKIEYWLIPPEAGGEFVAPMEVEEVLDLFEKPYNPADDEDRLGHRDGSTARRPLRRVREGDRRV